MNLFQAALLGIIQGIAEFLPVSSSGHLVVMKNLLGIGEIPLLFDVLLHIPTLLAIILVFRKRIAAIFRSLLKWAGRKNDETDRENLLLVGMIILASVPTALIGLGINEILDTFQARTGKNLFQAYPWIVSILFLCTAGFLISSKFFKPHKDYRRFGLNGSLIVGLAQGAGVLPGISRSGITISSSLLTGLEREKAGEFSFLMSIPAIIGAALIELKDMEAMQLAPLTLATGLVTSFIVGLISLLLLMKLVRRGRLYLFSIYLIPVGVISLVYFLA